MVAAGLGTSVLAGWAVAGVVDSGRVVAARVGREGIPVPWHAAVRSGDSSDDRRNLQVAELLARWCREQGGLKHASQSGGQ